MLYFLLHFKLVVLLLRLGLDVYVPSKCVVTNTYCSIYIFKFTILFLFFCFGIVVFRYVENVQLSRW